MKKDKSFFNRHADTVAEELLGLSLVRMFGETKRHYEIVESRSYTNVRILKDTPNVALFKHSPGAIFLYGRRGGHTLGIATRGTNAVSINKIQYKGIHIDDVVGELKLSKSDNGIFICTEHYWIQPHEIQYDDQKVDNSVFTADMNVFGRKYL